MRRFKLIRKKPIILAKPIAIIFNPAAGKGIELRKSISARLTSLDHSIELFET